MDSSMSIRSDTKAKPERVVDSPKVFITGLGEDITEHTLLRLCEKFGKIKAIDFMYYKVGEKRGRPRGYAFVEYETIKDAKRVIRGMNGKLFRGRKLLVNPALDKKAFDADDGGTGPVRNRYSHDQEKPSALSLKKEATNGATRSTKSKIALLEEKLAEMKKKSAPPAVSRSPTAEAELESVTGEKSEPEKKQ